MVLARESEGTSCQVQRRKERQLKDHIVFPPGITVSSEPVSRPALLGSAGGGRHIKAVCRQAYNSFHLEKCRLGGCPKRSRDPTPVCHTSLSVAVQEFAPVRPHGGPS